MLLGLALCALQNPLDRVLEGYTLWPNALYAYGGARRRQAKQDLQDRLTLIRLERREREGRLASDSPHAHTTGPAAQSAASPR
ncbi:hypothetical protein [Streptomyces sp. NPDC054975]